MPPLETQMVEPDQDCGFSSAGFSVDADCAGGLDLGPLPDIPSLKPRTPSPSPRINSGILRPPKRISTTTRMISQCIGNSILPPALSYSYPESSTFSAGRN